MIENELDYDPTDDMAGEPPMTAWQRSIMQPGCNASPYGLVYLYRKVKK
jgi:hypothetical protein